MSEFNTELINALNNIYQAIDAIKISDNNHIIYVLIIVLICVLISINLNLKKLIDLKKNDKNRL
ncbi:hypothetical protein [Romboutsia hominis]|uniref:hypothetical protein n=1 Tax=Romboutsia hominis TaxID=1507512 RepID=UPI000B867986|nr:hypothetical protein [Romboutsia hominis]